MSNQHVLKIHPAPLADLMSGAKTAEVRCNDRGFQVGDTVALREVNPFNDVWTGRPYPVRTISHIQTGYGLPDGMCVLSYADTAQREALARVEADNRQLQLIVNSHANMRDTAQAQLAEAVVMLHRYQELVSTIDMGSATAPMDWCSHFRNEVKRRTVELGAFLARHAQAEQQEARNVEVARESLRPENQRIEPVKPLRVPHPLEAQGAQAGDELAAFRKWFDDYSLAVRMNGGMMNDAQMYDAWQARAALATQPAAIKLPERKRTDHLTAEYKTMTPTRASIESYNRALDDVAALNAVRGAEHE